MKKLLYLLLAAFLFQSCFSYKTLDLSKDKLVVEKKYRIKLKDNHKRSRVELLAIGDSSITVLQYNKKREIQFSEIKKIERMKFSPFQTVLYPVGTTAALVAVFAISYSGN